MPSKKDRRIGAILEILKEKERMRISDLAAQLGVTPETLRNDLAGLADARMVAREHGYVRLVQALEERPIAIRSTENMDWKLSASLAALSRVRDGEVIFLDAGTTVIQGLEALRSKKDLTVATNSMVAAMALAGMNMKTIMVGGIVYNPGERTYGLFASTMIEHIQFDTVFLGSDGIEGAHGFTTLHESELEVKRTLLRQARKIVIICDKSKFDKRAPFMFCRFREADVLVTNHLSPKQLEQVSEVKEVIEV